MRYFGEDHLDRLAMPLVRRLPHHERQRIRQEMRDHLLERVQEITAQGVSADEAVGLAIRQLEAEWVGTLLLEKYRPLAR
ncbi:MAG: permease prefix domain 1-containing protein [Armatimonadota bacterium]